MAKESIQLKWNEIDIRLNCLANYAVIIAELKSSKSFENDRTHQLPTFEYYIENCIKNKGGAYDFTRNNYKSVRTTILKDYTPAMGIIVSNKSINSHSDTIVRETKSWSYWMGTAFNFSKLTEIINP